MIANAKIKSSGYVQKLAISSLPIQLLSVFGFHKGTATAWLQIHESATEPSGGATPVHTFAVGASDNFSMIIPVSGIPLDKCYLVLSTTADTYTAGSANVTIMATARGI